MTRSAVAADLSFLAPVAEGLDAVVQRARACVDDTGARVHERLNGSHLAGGKGLRAAVTLLAEAALRPGPSSLAAIDCAAALEMIHGATLVHDDILDGARVRRGFPALYEIWGVQTAVLSGDLLLAKAFGLLTALEDPLPARVVSRTAQELCEGEIEEITWRGIVDVSVADALGVIEAKTASLYGVAAEIGGACAGADAPQRAHLREAGLAIGRAFQITDDCLDVVCDEAQTGKPTGQDLGEGLLTLPWVFVREHLDASDRAAFDATFLDADDAGRNESMRAAWDPAPGVERSIEMAGRELARAEEIWAGLPTGAGRDGLMALGAFIRFRTR